MSSDDDFDLALSDSDEARQDRRRQRRRRRNPTRTRQRVVTVLDSDSDPDPGSGSDSDFADESSRGPPAAAHCADGSPSESSEEESGSAPAASSSHNLPFDRPQGSESRNALRHNVPQRRAVSGQNDGDSKPQPIDLLVIDRPANTEVEMASSDTEQLAPPRCSLLIESVLINGFKNFRDHVEVGPFSAFTCIVGPNGAGKSSILDAVSFVFGGRTSDLRGSSLSNLVNEELLQKGAQNKAQPATVTATVTVNMRASDRSIAVGRRVIIPNASQLSNARSEYILDGKKRSRADIGKLLADYGINIDMHGRFILLQSRTVNIIRQGPVQLLNHLEEIVGTLAIRAEIDQLRQQESSNQLELDEIQRDIATVGATRDALRPKVEAFLSYRNISAEYLCRRTAHLLKTEIVSAYQIERAEEVRKDCEKEQTVAEAELSKLTEGVRAEKAALTKAKRKAANASRRVSKAEESEQECKCETRKLTVQHRRAQKTATEAQEMLTTFNAKALELQATDKTLCVSAESLSSKITDLSAQIKSKQVLESSLGSDDRHKLKDLRSALAKFQEQVKHSNQGQLTAQLSQSNARCAELEEALRVENQNSQQLVRAQSQAQTRLDLSLTTKADANASEKRLQQQLTDLQHKAEQSSAVLSHLQQLSQDSRAGRYRAAVLDLSQKYPGVRGLLCDLGGCQRQHETAVNSVLRGTLSTTVVVDTRRDGIHVTNYFRQHRIGFVSCSILSETKELPAPTTAEKLQQSNPTQLTNLGDAIQCLPVYKPLWRRFCAGWCVATDQPAANQFSKQCNIVTSAGLIFKHDGEMRGSAIPRGKQHDINDLMVSSSSLQRASLHEAGPSSSADVSSQLAEAEALFKTVQSQVDETRTETITAGVRSRQAVSQEKQATAALARLAVQLSTSTAALSEATQERQRVQTLGNQLQEALSEAERAVDASIKTERQIERLLCSGDLVELHALREEADCKSTALQKQNKEIQRVQAALRSVRKEVTKQEKKQSTALKKLDSLSSTLLELETSQADASLSKQNASKQQADAEMEASALEVIVQKQQTKLKGLQTNYAAQRCILEDAEREAKNLRSQHCATAKALQDTYGEIADSLASVEMAAEANPELELRQAEPGSLPMRLTTAASDQVIFRLEDDEDELVSEMTEEQESVAVLAKQRKEAWKHVDMHAVEEDKRLEKHEEALTGKQNDSYQTMVRSRQP